MDFMSSQYAVPEPLDRASLNKVVGEMAALVRDVGTFSADYGTFFNDNTNFQSDADLIAALTQFVIDISQKHKDSQPAVIDFNVVIGRFYIFGLEGFNAEEGCAADFESTQDFEALGKCIERKINVMTKAYENVWKEIEAAGPQDESERCDAVWTYLCANSEIEVGALATAVGSDVGCFSDHLHKLASYIDEMADGVEDEALLLELTRANVYLGLVHFGGTHLVHAFMIAQDFMENGYEEGFSCDAHGDENKRGLSTRGLGAQPQAKRTLETFIDQLKRADTSKREETRQLLNLLRSRKQQHTQQSQKERSAVELLQNLRQLLNELHKK